MRISIVGESTVATTLREYISHPDVGYETMDCEHKHSHLTIFIQDTPEEFVVLDGSGSDFELSAIRHIQELSDGWPILLYRKGGKIHKDDRLSVQVPDGVEQRHAVEVGLLRAILETSRHGKKPKKPVALLTSGENAIPSLISVGIMALLLWFAAGKAHGQTTTVRVIDNSNGVLVNPGDSTNKAIRVTCITGCSGGGGGGSNSAASPTGAAVPADAGYTGINIAGILQGLTGTNPSGSIFAADVFIQNSSLPVTGVFWQATQPISGTVGISGTVPVSGTFFQATQPVSGTFFQATQPVSGTFWQATQPVSGTVTTTPPSNASTNVTQIGGAALALGQGAMAVSVPVVIASNQTGVPVTGAFFQATQPISGTVGISGTVPVSGTFFQATQPVSGTFWQATQPVSGTVTANAGTNLNTSLLALDATLTGGTQKAIVRGGAKGSTVSADITSTASGANHQPIDTVIYDTSGNPITSFGGGTQYSEGATAATATGTVAMGKSGTTITAVQTDSSGNVRIDLSQTSANATAIKVDGSAVTQPVSGNFFQATQPVSAASLPLPSGASTSAKQPALGTAGTASADVITVQGIASMTALKVDGTGGTFPVSGTVTANAGTNLNTSLLALDSTLTGGTQKTKIVDSGGTNVATVSAAGAVKVDGSAVTQPISGTVTANAGTNLNTSALALDASVNGIIVAQGSTTSGQVGPLIQTATTTAAPTYTTAKTNPLSTTTAGALRVDGSSVMQPVSGTFWQATQPVSGAFFQATQPISGTVTANAGTGTFTVTGAGGTFPVTGAFWQATQPISAASLPLPSGASTSAKQPALGTAGTASSDVITVQGIASMTAIKVDGTGGSFPISGTVTANAGTNLNTSLLALDTSVNGVLVAQGSTTSGQSGPLIQTATTTAAPTYTTAKTNPLSTTTAGALRVDGSAVTQPVSGTFFQATQPISAASLPLPSGASTSAKQPALGTAGTASADVITIQGIASMTAIKVDGTGGTFPISGTVTANAGTNLNTSLLALDASVNGILVAQGSTTSGQVGPLIQTATTTSAPTYTTAKTNPLSTTTAGALRVDNSAVTQPISGTVTANAGTNLNTSALALDATLTGGTQKTKIVDTGGTNVATVSAAGAVKVDGSAVTQPVSGTFFQATQPVSAASLPLPSGAATEVTLLLLPVAQGSATSGEKGPLVQGAVTTAAPSYTTAQTSPLSLTTAGALRVDNSAVTQPVSGTVTANAGTGTFIVAGGGTAGSAATGVLTIQGIASMTKLLVTPDANSAVNVAQVNGATVNVGNGVSSTGTQRVAVAPGGTIGLEAGSSAIGSVTANAGTNLNTSALALDATLTGGTAKSITRGGAKGSTTAADITSTASGANHQPIDAVIYDTSGNAITSFGGGTQYAEGATAATATGTVAMGKSGTTIKAFLTDSSGNQLVTGTGTAGTAASGVLTIQGIASMTKLLVTPDSVALPANQSVNVSQINGVTPLMGNGTTGTGSPRVTIASDNTAFTVNATQSGTWTAQIGNTANTTPILAEESCNVNAPVTFDTSSSGNLQLVAASGSTKIYVCHFAFQDIGGGNTVQLKYGTGSSCGTGTGAFGMAFVSASAAAMDYNGPAVTAASQALCVNLANATRVTGEITYAQR